MIRRLVEADYLAHYPGATSPQRAFWLRTCRTPEILFSLAANHPEEARPLLSVRPLLEHAFKNNLPALEAGLEEERRREQAADRVYWTPLRQELEKLRHRR